VLISNFFCALGTEMVQRNSWRTRNERKNVQFADIDGSRSNDDAGL
jgi:hypothetical protein